MHTRIPLNTLAIGFGLAGLAEVWGVAGDTFGFPPLIAQLFWLATAIAWIWLIVAHTVRGARSRDTLLSQLRHPVQGPIAALAPVTGMLLAGDLLRFSQPAGTVLFLIFVAAAALFSGWLIGTWLQGGFAIESVHGGYLLPTVASGLVGADVAAQARLTELGWALFGVGLLFWAVMTVLVVFRLAFRPALPDPLVPTMAILVAPPAVAGLAWFSLTGVHYSVIGAMLLGLLVLLVLVQLALIPRYRRLPFSLGFWSFTFSAAAVLADAMLWLQLAAFPGWQFAAALLLIIATVLIGGIGIRSLLAVRSRRLEGRAERVLVEADASVADPDSAMVPDTTRVLVNS
ncbi:MAG: transporter [Pseudolysinimonas sp.]